MTPKSLLRHAKAVSDFQEIGPDTEFQPLISDETAKSNDTQKVILCSGKVFYDIAAERDKRNLQNKIAILRVEQLCPFPFNQLMQNMDRYPNAKAQQFTLKRR